VKEVLVEVTKNSCGFISERRLLRRWSTSKETFNIVKDSSPLLAMTKEVDVRVVRREDLKFID
jgi:hypothetical protein